MTLIRAAESMIAELVRWAQYVPVYYWSFHYKPHQYIEALDNALIDALMRLIDSGIYPDLYLAASDRYVWASCPQLLPVAYRAGPARPEEWRDQLRRWKERKETREIHLLVIHGNENKIIFYDPSYVVIPHNRVVMLTVDNFAETANDIVSYMLRACGSEDRVRRKIDKTKIYARTMANVLSNAMEQWFHEHPDDAEAMVWLCNTIQIRHLVWWSGLHKYMDEVTREAFVRILGHIRYNETVYHTHNLRYHEADASWPAWRFDDRNNVDWISAGIWLWPFKVRPAAWRGLARWIRDELIPHMYRIRREIEGSKR